MFVFFIFTNDTPRVVLSAGARETSSVFHCWRHKRYWVNGDLFILTERSYHINSRMVRSVFYSSLSGIILDRLSRLGNCLSRGWRCANNISMRRRKMKVACSGDLFFFSHCKKIVIFILLRSEKKVVSRAITAVDDRFFLTEEIQKNEYCWRRRTNTTVGHNIN